MSMTPYTYSVSLSKAGKTMDFYHSLANETALMEPEGREYIRAEKEIEIRAENFCNNT